MFWIRRIFKAWIAARKALWRDERGSTTLLVALSTPVVVGALGVGVDTGAWYVEKRRVQQIADSASLGAARALAGGSDLATAQAIALRDAARNGFSASASHTITINSPPSSGAYAGKEGAVEAIVTRPLPSLFSTFLLGDGARTVRGRTVAAVKEIVDSAPGAAACMLALAPTGQKAIFMNGSGSVIAQNCTMVALSSDLKALYLNGSGTIGGYTAVLRGGHYANGSGSFVFTRPPITGFTGTVDDPYAELADPELTGPCTKSSFVNSGSTVTLSPGRYCYGIRNSGSGTINLLPGTYYIDRGNVENSSSGSIQCPTCTGDLGVTLVFTANSGFTSQIGSLISNGSGSVILSAPGPSTGEPYVGMVVYVDRRASMTSQELGVDNGGSGQFELSGAVYVPSRQVKLNGTGTVGQTGKACVTITAQTITMIGSGTIQTTDCGQMGTLVPRPTIVALLIVE